MTWLMLPISSSCLSTPTATIRNSPGSRGPDTTRSIRRGIYDPACEQSGGQGIAYLEEKRSTSKVFQDEKDSWEGCAKSTADDRPRAGRAIFYELGWHAHVYHHDVTETG